MPNMIVKFVTFILVLILAIPLLNNSATLASGGSYSLAFTAADPAVNYGPYAPTYPKKLPNQFSCPAAATSNGRTDDPLSNAVYLSPITPFHQDALTSLAPQYLALGEIVPYEVNISVNGSTDPENGVIQFTAGWNTKTTSGDDFGYDPAYMVYCAFVDTADHGTVDPGNNARVTNINSSLAYPGTSNEEIQSTITVGGLDSGDSATVEIWLVLKSAILKGVTGNIQSKLISAQTATGDPINTGNQIVPLRQVGEFFSANADLSISKSDSPDPVSQGGQLTYTIVVSNTSADTVANGIVITDTLDPNTSFSSVSGSTCSNAAGTVTCNIGALSPGNSITITLVVIVSNTAPADGTAESGQCMVGDQGVDLCNIVILTAITSDSNTTNNTASQPTNVNANIASNPALTLSKSADQAGYSQAGQTISYTYILTNTGNISLNGPFTVSDDKTIVSCPNTSTLAPGDSLTCTAMYSITQADLDTGSVTNTATASNGTVTSNQVMATVTATQTQSLAIKKSAIESTYSHTGDTVHYSYIVTNTGNITLNGPFTVSDNKTATSCPATASLAPSVTVTCTATYTITQADLDAGSVTNSAYASAGNISSQPDFVTVPATQSAALSLAKIATPATYSTLGATINYSYNITNTGNVTLAGPFAVSDDKTPVTCPATSTLAPGAAIMCSATYTISQADIDAGSVTNHATASASFNSGPVSSNQATATVTATQIPQLTLAKNAYPGIYTQIGDVINYAYIVTNTGNVTLHGPFSVSDNKTSVSCPQAANLAPGAATTCTASYTITQADVNAGSVTNLATASNGTITSNQASATVFKVAATGRLTPTGTTCSQFATNTAPDLTQVMYLVKANQINSVAPGVFFYYTKVVAPTPAVANLQIKVVQTNNRAFPAMGIQTTGQIVLYNSNCAKSSKQGNTTVTTDKTTQTQTATITVNGATAGEVFYVGIKYDPDTVVGFVVGKPFPTVTYTFVTNMNGDILPSRDRLNLASK